MQKQVDFSATAHNQLSEEHQANKTEFAFCRYDPETDKIIQCCQFVHCRDFLGDAMVGYKSNRPMSIYGFNYSKSDPALDEGWTSILVRFDTDEALANFQKNFIILKSLEEFMNFGVSFPDIVNYPGDKKVAWVIADALWQENAINLSLYTYLLKCLTYTFKDPKNWMEEIKAAGTTESHYMDIDYLKGLFPKLKEIALKFKTFTGFTNQKTLDISTIHHGTGFVSCKPLVQKQHSGNAYKDHCLAY